MIPKKDKSGNKLVCRICGYTKKVKKEIKFSTTVKKRKTESIAITSAEESKAREEERLFIEDIYKDSLEYFEKE